MRLGWGLGLCLPDESGGGGSAAPENLTLGGEQLTLDGEDLTLTTPDSEE